MKWLPPDILSPLTPSPLSAQKILFPICILAILWNVQDSMHIWNYFFHSIKFLHKKFRNYFEKKLKKNENFIRVELHDFDLLKAFIHFVNQILFGVGFNETKRFFISFSKVLLFFRRFNWIVFHASCLCEKLYFSKKLDFLTNIDKTKVYLFMKKYVFMTWAYSPTFIPPHCQKIRDLPQSLSIWY